MVIQQKRFKASFWFTSRRILCRLRFNMEAKSFSYNPCRKLKMLAIPEALIIKPYSLFHGITHQVFLAEGDYFVLPGTNKMVFEDLIFKTRKWVVENLRTYIKGDKEQGLAEALLIGYKDDLDKNLVQAYSNTGVVHIIAISGLHLGLIYVLLVFLTRGLKKYKKAAWIRFLIIVISLWLFSILAGGQPSVLRSAVMFTIIAGGEIVIRRTNILTRLPYQLLYFFASIHFGCGTLASSFLMQPY
jgi:competence protein ComEC